VVVTLLLVLGAAFLTDIIGINVIFGGFVCGLLIPNEGPFAGMLREKIEDYVSILFLPLYFASSGLKTNLSAIKSNTGMAMLFMVIGAACVGKIMGTVIVATAWGMARQKAFVLGFLMNTKGLVELIVLNIGLAKGVCKPFLFVNL
jgi:Kef-type K+ transport system membrane component KefB